MFIYALCGGNKEVSVKLNTGTYVTFARVLQYACIFFEICFFTRVCTFGIYFLLYLSTSSCTLDPNEVAMFVQGT